MEAFADSFTARYLAETEAIAHELVGVAPSIEAAAEVLSEVREAGGRLFVCGSGGGAGHASHAVCDFRKLGEIEAYSISDNVSELTARVNDEGWDTAYERWLAVSRVGAGDALLCFSVGGGDAERSLSLNLVNAARLAADNGAKVVAVVGRKDGYLQRNADVCIRVPNPAPERITPHTEGFQAVIWHLLISHPSVQRQPTMY
jgi:D-sedoheptulose 7-phosphate isomerase